MSLFTTHTFLTDDGIGRAIFDGVMLERRTMLRLSLGALTSLGLSWAGNARSEFCSASGAAQSASVIGKMPWEVFIDEILPLAEDLVAAPRPDEDCYLRQLDTLVSGLEELPRASFEAGSTVASTYAFEKYPVMIMQFRFSPGAAIPCHDHRDYNGILKVTAGHVRIRTFEHLSSRRPPLGETFEIREIDNRVLGPGDRSHLSRSRNNIHYLRAQAQGAQVLDVFTFFRKDGESVYLDVNGIDDCTDCSKRVYDARWAE